MGTWGWEDGEMGRWGDGEMGRWGQGAIEINYSLPTPKCSLFTVHCSLFANSYAILCLHDYQLGQYLVLVSRRECGRIQQSSWQFLHLVFVE